VITIPVGFLTGVSEVRVCEKAYTHRAITSTIVFANVRVGTKPGLPIRDIKWGIPRVGTAFENYTLVSSNEEWKIICGGSQVVSFSLL
jgi:hypothetical protein